MTNRNQLARTSNTPGRTQLINFFQNENKQTLVDLPGYGYAKMPTLVKRKMIVMIEEYFTSREQLVKTFVLVDSRIGPTIDDEMMIDYLNKTGREVMVLITKSDKANQKQLHLTKEKLKDIFGDLMVISSVKGTNISKLKKIIDSHF